MTTPQYKTLVQIWAEEDGIQLKVDEDEHGRKVISIWHYDGENCASATIAPYRLARIITALQENIP